MDPWERGALLSFSCNKFANYKDDISPEVLEVFESLKIKPTQMKVGSKILNSIDIKFLDLKQYLSQPYL